MTEMIQVEHVSKTYEVVKQKSGMFDAMKHLIKPTYTTVEAVKDINFQVERGELIGYLGPNGAGKSTTLKMLAGLLVPTSGKIVVDGLIPWKKRQKYVSRIGAVFGQRTGLYWDLPVQDSLKLLEPMYKIPKDRFKQNLNNYCEILGMEDILAKPVRSLSLGQRMRADLCAALLHDPVLLFLDEPTIGLDVVAKERIRQFIKWINKERETTIVLTTHDINDVEKLCERIIIIDQGHLLYDGQLDTLSERFDSNRKLIVRFAEEYGDVSLPGLAAPVKQGKNVVYSYNAKQVTAQELINSLMARFTVLDLEVRQAELETTIRRIYEERLLEGQAIHAD
jgi:ABC-2 type transport system ATP-binding protein